MHDLCGVGAVCSRMGSVEWVCVLHGLYGVVMRGLCGLGVAWVWSARPSERILLLLNLSSCAGGASAKLPIRASHTYTCAYISLGQVPRTEQSWD